MKKVTINDLKIDENLIKFINDEDIPGTRLDSDHFWKEFTGKLFATVVASHEKGLTVHDQLRTVARQCYAWVMPYGVSFLEKVDIKDGEVVTDELKNRLNMLQKDIQVYGKLLASQRSIDLAGTEPGFLALLRK